MVVTSADTSSSSAGSKRSSTRRAGWTGGTCEEFPGHEDRAANAILFRPEVLPSISSGRGLLKLERLPWSATRRTHGRDPADSPGIEANRCFSLEVRESFNSAVVAGIVTSAFYVIVAIFSEGTLHDIIAALGIMIYWYYGITALARAWCLRKELFTSLYNFVFKLTFPLLADLILAAVFAYLIRERMRTPGGERCGHRRDRPGVLPGLRHPRTGVVLMPVIGRRIRHSSRARPLARDTPALIAEE